MLLFLPSLPHKLDGPKKSRLRRLPGANECPPRGGTTPARERTRASAAYAATRKASRQPKKACWVALHCLRDTSAGASIEE